MARKERYDIVDSWMHPADYVAALSRPITRTPVVMAARIDQLPRIRMGPATPMLKAAVHRATDVVVANADIAARDAVRHGVPPDKVRIIRGGVKTPRAFSADERRTLRASIGITDEHFLVGCVGTFRPMKRQDLLIDAFSRLLADRPELRLVLVGDGDLRPKIEAQVDRLGLGESVILFGTGTDMPPLYDAFDLFVQASNSEALPNVLLEASAAGLPIVATAAGGSGEVIHDGETGLLVPIDDVEQLTVAIDTALADAGLRRRLGVAARELVERDYGMDRFMREYRDLYLELLARSGRLGD
jgi:glycosyltransferase involved in cell wall biosynthesis